MAGLAATSGRNTSAESGLDYPEPLVFQSLKDHKSTLIMLHGLGERGGERSAAACPCVPAPQRGHALGVASLLYSCAGDTGMGWADIGPLLQPDLPHTRFVFPTAPMASDARWQGADPPLHPNPACLCACAAAAYRSLLPVRAASSLAPEQPGHIAFCYLLPGCSAPSP